MDISEVADLDRVRTLCEKLTALTGAVTALLDLDGNILIATGWQDICTRFHRAHPGTAARCRESDTVLAGRLDSGSRHTLYRCMNGLCDAAVPIRIGGKHVANFFTGQFFLEPPDPAFFERQAAEFGFDREEYLAALSRVPVFPQERVDAILSFFVSLVDLLGEMGNDRKAAEDEARQRKALFDESPDGMVIIEPATARILEFNRAAHLQLGYTREEFARLTVPDVEAAESRQETAERIRGVLETGSADFETRQRRRDGEIRDVHVTAKLIETGSGKVYQATWRDVTDFKASVSALKQANEKLRLLFDLLPVGVSVLDESRRIVMHNRRLEEIIGLAADEIASGGQAGRRFLRPDGSDMLAAELASSRIFSGEAMALDVETGFVREDGKTAWVNVNAAATPFPDWKAVLVVSDVTRHKQLERQLFQAQKMESVGRLAGGVAHDFNNMLVIILGHAELALKQAPPGSPLFEQLTEIREAGRRAADITRQLLAFARKQVSVPKVVDLNAAIGDMLKMVGRLIGEDITLAWRPGDSLGRVRIDPSQVDQVIANLATNARDAIDGVGRVTIETWNDPASPFVVLAFSDDGCGIEPKQHAAIFEPFYTTKSEGRGTGLGLATVHGIVEQNGGSIEVSSERGKGTTFLVRLPRFDEDAAAPGAPAAETEGGSETILVVEDEAPALVLLTRFLTSIGYRALPADGPEAALEIARNPGKIDLLLTDVVMPGMNGRDLADAIEATRPGLRRIFMSGYTSDVISQRGVIDMGKGFLQKPFQLDDLAERIRAVLDDPPPPRDRQAGARP